MNPDEQFVLQNVQALVDYPQDVRTERTTDEMGVLITLSVNPSDMGKVIGREGNTAKALRTLLRAVGTKNGSKVNMKILEPAGSTHRAYRDPSDAEQFGGGSGRGN